MAEKATLPHPDAVTNNQIDGLLRICAAMTGAMGVTHGTGVDTSEPILPEEARIAAEQTFWAACNQLKKIIEDPLRWNLTFQRVLEARAEALFKQQGEFMQAQIAAAGEVSKPHFKYRPEMKRLPDGKWITFVGEPNVDIGNCIFGIGRTPAESVDAFDDNFHGTLTPYMQQWLNEREAEASQQQPKTSHEEQNNLDAGTDGQAS